MAHFGVTCPASPGHINPMMSLCRALQNCGNQITFYQVLDAEDNIRAGGFPVRIYGAEAFPKGFVPRAIGQLGELTGKEAQKFTIDLLGKGIQASLDEVPPLARQDGVDVFLVDQATMQGGTIAEELGVPWIMISNALILNHSSKVPPYFTTWPLSKGPLSRLRNHLTWKAYGRMLKPNLAAINGHRRKKGFKVFKEHADVASRSLAQISQQPREFEFPRSDLPSNFHFAGPFHDDRVREPAPFPYEKLTGAPLVYASMGTLQNRQEEIFGCIAEACDGLEVQLVISLGGGSKPENLRGLKGSPLVQEFVPQLDILKRARLCITHAGLNTVLESLARAVPMVAIPITNDQPGVAARLAWTGAGEFTPSKKLTPALLRAAIRRVLDRPEYSRNAARMRAAIQKSGGARLAAEIIDRTIL
jgi:zeaxanthin glucosyltransferase